MKTLIRKSRRLGAVLTALAMLLGLFPAWTAAADTAPTPKVTFTFTDSGITADSTTATGYSIDGTALTITSSGAYGVTGSCADGSIAVKKDTSGVQLVMEDFTLSCSTTAPLVCKKGSSVTLWAEGTSTLTDAEDASTEDTNEDFEGAAIKVKAGGTLVIAGSGTLNLNGNAKNGVKGAGASYDDDGAVEYSGTKVIVAGGTVNIAAENHGLACDNEVIITGGTLNISAGNDGIKAEADDDDSDGTITIYDGTITVNAESDGINASGDIVVYGGTFDIDAQSDGIQTDGNLTISDGTFDIQTLDGYNSSSFNSDTMSCKGLKASCSDDEDSDTSEADNMITISGGTFTLDTADDAVHSDAYVEITGGKLTIDTGDDGVHADTSLILGTDRGTVARDPDITVNHSYECLEAGTVYIYSGRYYVVASDDGINAAGGSSNGSDPGGGGGNTFNPGGGFPGGGPGGGGGGRLMTVGSAQLMAGDYSLNIAGGNVYVNADGDGLDSNGALNLTGGNIEVWAQYNADNEPLDCDGTLTVNGATVFAAGSAGMGVASPSSGSQSYVNVGGSSGGFGGGPGGGSSGTTSGSISISSGNLVTVANASGSTVYQASAPKSANYVFFSSPDSTTWTVTSGSGSVNCQYGNSWAHSWNSGAVTTAATENASGVRTYTCADCGETEAETIPQLVSVPDISEFVDNSSDDTGDETDEGFTVTFATDGHATVNVYYTQDYTTVDETDVTSTVSRNSDTGTADSTGDGQVNFTVVPADGYTVESVTATDGTYKNIKGPDDTGLANTYRITKITATTTVTITTTADSGGDTGDDSGDETDEGFTVTFATDGHATVNVYYTQEYTTADETDVTSTVSRNSDTGEASSTDGQVNFTVVPADGYTVDSVTVTEGTYKNIKGPDDTGLANTYRVTKITADTTVTITTTADSGGDTGDDDETDEGFTVTFATDGHATVNVYYTQDYTTADETDVTSTVSRNSDTGAADSTGDGQVNFTVVPADGYTVDSVTVTEGTYKNIKGPDDTGLANTYRVTKITADTTVTITTTADSGGDTGDDEVTVESISVKTNPTRTVYTIGDAFAPSGLVLTVTNSDSTTADVAYSARTGMTFSGFDSSSAGTKTVTVTYEGQTATFTVTVEAAAEVTVSGISVKTNPTRTVYTVGDSFAPSGLVLTVTYSDSTTADVAYSASAGMTFSGFDSSSAGTKTVTVTYDGQTATFTVTVEAASNTGDDSGGGSQGQKQGCYVATAVYGSYDCPEVWTLRRFRDEILGETWYGRLFIRCYYAVSPTVVRLFGENAWFQDFWRGRLDSMVSQLQEDGFASTPYEDLNW